MQETQLRCRFDPWIKKQQPTPVFWPGKFHGQRRLAGLQSMGSHARESLCKGFSVATWTWSIYMHVLVIDSPCLCGNNLQWMTDSSFCRRSTHAHWAGDTIQPSHPLSPRSPPALNLPQHQSLFQWIADCPSVMLQSTLVSLHPRWDNEVHIFQLFPQLPSRTVLQNIDLFDNIYWLLQFCLNSLFPYWYFPGITSQADCLQSKTHFSVNFYGNSN